MTKNKQSLARNARTQNCKYFKRFLDHQQALLERSKAYFQKVEKLALRWLRRLCARKVMTLDEIILFAKSREELNLSASEFVVKRMYAERNSSIERERAFYRVELRKLRRFLN